MPFQETITIINNSGKIISTGKQLANLFKEAKASYQEKRATIKYDRALQRAQTFDVSRSRDPPLELDRRLSHDDTRSRASRRSNGSRRSRSTRHKDHPRHTALTESNLRTLSEVSSTGPSIPPRAYRAPYAETAPRDMALSKPSLLRSQTEGIVTERGVVRSSSDPSLRDKEIDMHLAYGNIPPDLASRVDLDPAYQAAAKERRAKNLVSHVEGLLDEAHCLHHTATSIIAHLQNNPEAAAAVALTLAELSTLLTKMSPGFLSIIKGGSPAVFALLASPQFLIGAGVAVGVTIVMFGGWKIIKRIKEANAARQDTAMAFAAVPGADGGIDEALVLEEEMSTIESWRRGIVPFGEDESADLELISPEAERAMKAKRREEDGVSNSGRTEKTLRSHRSGKSRKRRDVDGDIPERKSSRGATQVSGDRDRDSRVGSERSGKRSTASKRLERVEVKAIEGSKVDSSDLVLRPKERKGSMLKTLFKKKEKDGSRISSIMA